MTRFFLFLLLSNINFFGAHAEMSNREVLEHHLKPVDFAKLAAHIYGQDNAGLPDNVEEIAQETAESVRFGYYRFSHSGTVKNVFVIRGTDNVGNVIVDIGLLPGWSQPLIGTIAQGILHSFEMQHGPCAFATGHSLGGKLLESLPSDILCFSFNAALNKNIYNIYDYRTRGDILQHGRFCHTDFWIEHPTNVSDSDAHRILYLIEHLPISKFADWAIAVLDRADALKNESLESYKKYRELTTCPSPVPGSDKRIEVSMRRGLVPFVLEKTCTLQ